LDSNPRFVGHQSSIELIRLKLETEGKLQYNHRLALYGLVGVGKTQLALEYAYRNKQKYSGIFWLDAQDQDSILASFEYVASEVNCIPDHLTLPRDLKAKYFLKWLRSKENWLLVMDNLNDLTMVRNLLPSAACSGHTLITTRSAHYGGIPAAGFEVLPMEPHESITFLLQQADMNVAEGGAIATGMITQAERIVKELGHLPLAMEQAAGYIRQAQSIYAFLPAYNRSKRRMLEWMPKGNFQYERSMAEALRVDIEFVRDSSPISIDLLQFLAFLPSEEVSLEFLRAGSSALRMARIKEVIDDDDMLQECIDHLRNYSLLKVPQGGSRFSRHKLVQAFMEDLADEDTRSAIRLDLIRLGSMAFPKPNDPLAREKCGRFYSQALSCLEHSHDTLFTTELRELASNLRQFFLLEGGPETALPLAIEEVWKQGNILLNYLDTSNIPTNSPEALPESEEAPSASGRETSLRPSLSALSVMSWILPCLQVRDVPGRAGFGSSRTA
jgi:hypothetical protein